jgi:hypothetical protein
MTQEEIEKSDQEMARKMLGLPKQLTHRTGNTYFTKMGELIIADLITDEHGRWIGAIFQNELRVEDQEQIADTLVNLYNSRLPRVVCPHCHQESETRLYLGVCEECNAHFNQRDLGSKY